MAEYKSAADFSISMDKVAKLVMQTVKATRDLNNSNKNLDTSYREVNTSVKQTAQSAENLNKVYKRADAETKNMKNSQTSLKSIFGEVKAISESLNSIMIKMTEILKKASKPPKEMAQSFSSLDGALDAVGITSKDIEKNFDVLKSRINSSGSAVKNLTDNNGRLLTINEKIVNGQKRFTTSLTTVDNAVDKNARQADKWKYSWSKAFQSFTTYMSVTTVFYQAIRAVKSMVNEVVELDTSLVELRKVTDLEGQSLKNFTSKAYDAGKAVAKTGQEMIEASTEFARAGFDEKQLLNLATVATMYQNVADEEISAAESAEFIIAQMKAFNIEAENAMHIIDAVNEVSNNYAISSADLANNIGVASAALASSNTTYEQSLAMLTAITEQTRNASKAANALKTLGARIRGLDDEGNELKNLVPKLEKEFNSLGVAMTDANGQVRSTYDLMKDLASVWPTLTDNQKTYMAELSAGKFQLNNFLALMNNFNVAIEANETALNSNGSALKENEKKLESIKGKLAALKSEWEKLSQSIVSSNLVKLIVDLGTALLKFANTGLGQFIIKGGLAVGAIVILKKSYNALSMAIKEYAATQILANAGITDFTTKANKLALNNTIQSLTLGNGLLKSFTGLLSGATKNVGFLGSALKMLKNPITIILLIITTLVAVSAKLEKSRMSLEKEKKAIEKTGKELNDINKKLKETEERVEELKGFGYLSFTEQEELNKLEEQLSLLKKERNELQKIYDLEVKRKKEKAKNIAETLLNEGDRILTPENGDNFNKPKDIAIGGFKDNSSFHPNTDLGTPYTTKEEEQSLTNLLDLYDKELNKKNELKNQNTKLNKQTKEEIENEKTLEDTKKKLNEALEKYKEAYDAAVESGDAELKVETWDKYLSILKKINKEEYDRITNLIPNSKKMVESYDDINSIALKYNKTQKISAKDAKTLIDAGLRSAITFNEEGKAVSLDTSQMWNLYKAKLQVQKTNLDDAAKKTLAALQVEGKGVGLTIAQYVQLLKAKKAAFYAEGKQGPWKYTKEEQELLDIYEQSLDIQKIINGLSNKIKPTSPSGGGGSGSDIPKWQKELEKLNKKFADGELTIEQYIKKLESLRKKYKKTSAARKELDKLIRDTKLFKLQDDFERGLITVDEYIEGLKNLQKQVREGTEEWKDYADSIKEALQEKYSKYESDYEKTVNAAIDLIEKEQEAIENQITSVEKYYDDLIESKEKANEETKKEIELARLQEALYNAQNERNKRVFVQGIGWQWTTDKEAIENAEKELNDFINEQEIQDLENQKEEEINILQDKIDILEDYKEQWESILVDYEEQQDELILIQTLGADAEKDILSGRIETLKNFRDNYISIMSDIATIDKMTAEDISKGLFTPTYIPGFANGGVVDYTGYARVHGSINKPEIVLSNSQAASLYSMLSRPQTSPINNSNTSNSNIYNFDKLILPNVTNANQFITELKTKINVTKNQ